MQIRERQRLDQPDRRLVVGVRLPREPGDDVRAETEHREPLRQPVDARPVGLRGVPVPAHALEDPVRSRLEWCVEVRRHVARSLDQQPGDGVIDLGRFDRRQPEADLRDGAHKSIQQLAQ